MRTIDSLRQKIVGRKLPTATAARLDAAVVTAERPLIPPALAKDCVIVAKKVVIRPFRATKLTKVKPRPPHDHEQGDTDAEVEPLPPAPGGHKSLPGEPQAKLVPFKGGKPGQRGLAATADTTSPVRVFLRSNLGEPQGIAGYPLEPQVASAGGVIFLSGNSQAAYSTDNGRTFTFLPSVDSMFGIPEGGYVGDSVVRYAPQIDRFLWLMQYDCRGGDCSRPPYNRYRLAVASPGAIRGNAANPERAWRVYNLTTAMFGEGSWFDFPIMSVGETQLFLTWNSVSQHAVNARMNLHQLQLGAPASVYHFTHRQETFWRTAEHAGTTGYWIRNSDDDGHAVVYHLDDASGLIFWDTVEHDRIPQFDVGSNSPLGTVWNGRGTPSGAQVASAVVRRGTLWVAWTAGRRFTSGGAMEWRQPHVYIAQYSLPSLELVSNMNVWQRDYAIVGPGLTVNPEGDVAMMASIGGPSMAPRPAAGLLTGRDARTLFEVWTSDPTAGAGQGDYSMVEPEYPGGTRFVTIGYVTNLRAGVATNEYVFMRFGRSAADLRPPTVTIDWPREGSSYELGQTVPLRGSAYDEEDGTITGDALIWRLGTIIVGRGTSPEYRPFAVGDQTITLSVADSGRRVGTATVHIHVVRSTGRPSCLHRLAGERDELPARPRRLSRLRGPGDRSVRDHAHAALDGRVHGRARTDGAARARHRPAYQHPPLLDRDLTHPAPDHRHGDERSRPDRDRHDHGHLRRLQLTGPPGQHPEEGRRALRLGDRLEVVADDIEARLPNEPYRHLGLVAAEERLDAAESLAAPGGQVRGAEGGEQMPARPQPRGDALEQLPELLPRHVVEHIEGDDGVERRCFELDLDEVGMQEAGARDALARAAHLLGRDVDADELGTLGEHPRRADARPGPELEHVRPPRQQSQQLLEPLKPRRAGDLPLPSRKEVGTGVVAAGDDVLRPVIHATSLLLGAEPLDHGGDRLALADAHRRDSVAGVPPVELVQQVAVIRAPVAPSG